LPGSKNFAMPSLKLLLAMVSLLATSALAVDPAPAKPETSPAQEFDVPVPLGIPVKGIKIPHRNDDGKLVMMIEAEVAKKLDASHIEMENMKIESYEEEGKTLVIEVPRSVFDTDTRILTGDSRTNIRREDFEIAGDSVVFNTKTRHATLRGNITMTIQSANIEQ